MGGKLPGGVTQTMTWFWSALDGIHNCSMLNMAILAVDHVTCIVRNAIAGESFASSKFVGITNSYFLNTLKTSLRKQSD